MRVTCIDVDDLINPRNGHMLTIGKEYDILEVEGDTVEGRIYWLIDDTNWKRYFDASRFVPTLEEIRDRKIEEIIK